jgi:hypothetical protein
MPSNNCAIERLEPFIFQLPITRGLRIARIEKAANGSQFGYR